MAGENSKTPLPAGPPSMCFNKDDFMKVKVPTMGISSLPTPGGGFLRSY